MNKQDAPLQELQTLRTEAFDRMNAAFEAYMQQVPVVNQAVTTSEFAAELAKLQELHAEYATAANEHERLVERIYKFFI